MSRFLRLESLKMTSGNGPENWLSLILKLKMWVSNWTSCDFENVPVRFLLDRSCATTLDLLLHVIPVHEQGDTDRPLTVYFQSDSLPKLSTWSDFNANRALASPGTSLLNKNPRKQIQLIKNRDWGIQHTLILLAFRPIIPIPGLSSFFLLFYLRHCDIYPLYIPPSTLQTARSTVSLCLCPIPTSSNFSSSFSNYSMDHCCITNISLFFDSPHTYSLNIPT